jgi:hypothetical protein
MKRKRREIVVCEVNVCEFNEISMKGMNELLVP